MPKQRIVIVGAGISGLAAAWYLKQTGLPLEITILEKSERAGGWLHTDHTTGFHFEKGPRTFKVNKSPSTMRLIAELNLQDELVWSEARPHHRYLWLNGELHRFPTNPISFLFSPLTKGFMRAAFAEWEKPAQLGDETVWEFVMRRFNYDVARLFFDPMVVGIFGGDIRKISMHACFPKLKLWEEQYGSITKGFWTQWKVNRHCSKFSSDIPGLPLSAVFSFKKGIEQLVHALVTKTDARMHFNQNVLDIKRKGEQYEVRTHNNVYTADVIFSALPVYDTAKLFEPHVTDLASELQKVPSAGIAVINFGYDRSLLPVQGFGYLTPTYSYEDILGCIFDSSVFPQLNRRREETRLTIKIEETGKSEDWYINSALRGIRRHLGISQIPTAMTFKRTVRAIPQYGVGHLEKMTELKTSFQRRLHNCFLLGNFLSGVSVDQCIARAKEAVHEWQQNQSCPQE